MTDATDILKQMLADKAGQGEVALHTAKSLGVYGEGSQELSDIAGKYLGPKAAGVVGAAADAAPYAITEGGLLGKDALPELGSYLELTGKYPSYTKTTIPTAQLDPALHPPTFTPPDGAESVVAMDPETGRQVAHVTYVPRGDGVQGLRMDTAPDWRGKGIASDLLRDAISQAHDRGLPYQSDTQVSIPAARVYEKVPGASRNDAVDMSHDPHDGDVGVSGNGRPIYEVPRPVDADDAQVGETPHFDPNGSDIPHFADGGPVRLAGGGDGGELAPVLDDIGALVAKYAEGAPNDHAAQLADAVKTDGGVTYNPTTGDVHTSGYAVPSEPSRSVALDSSPSASDIHDFMLQNQDAFDNPKAALHIESDDGGNHFMHVAHLEPTFDDAMTAARQFGAPGVRELHTGTNFPSANV